MPVCLLTRLSAAQWPCLSFYPCPLRLFRHKNKQELNKHFCNKQILQWGPHKTEEHLESHYVLLISKSMKVRRRERATWIGRCAEGIKDIKRLESETGNLNKDSSASLQRLNGKISHLEEYFVLWAGDIGGKKGSSQMPGEGFSSLFFFSAFLRPVLRMWLTLSTNLALPRILHGTWFINICRMEAPCIKTKLSTVLLIEVH